MQLAIPAITIKAMLGGFERLGFERADLLNGTRFNPDSLEDPFASVLNLEYSVIWRNALMARPSCTLPIECGMAVPFSEFGMLDHLVMLTDTIGEGFHTLNLFFWLVSVNMRIDFDHVGGDRVYVVNEPAEENSHIPEQWTIGIMVERWRSMVDGFGIDEVYLTVPAAGDAAPFEALFGVPVYLGREKNGFKLSKGVWGRANCLANPALKRSLWTAAEQIEITQVEEAPLIYAIKTRLPQALEEGAFSAEDIAAELGLSKRTLQRKLSAENMTFKELLDLYRQEQAFDMLKGGERNMTYIAYALGYNEQSSFNRAFRRWSGLSPTAWLTQN